MSKKVLVIGETANDSYLYGKVSPRTNPEAPSLIFSAEYEESAGGMSLNVKNNLESLDPSLEVFHLTQKTIIQKRRFVDKTSNYILLRCDLNDQVPDRERINIEKFNEYLEKNHLKISDFAGIVFSDYCKEFIDAETIRDISTSALFKNVPTFLDSKKILAKWSRDVFCVKINNREYEANREYNPKPEKFCENLVVSAGENGCIWVNRGLKIPTNRVSVVDLVGCGDVLLAGIVVSYLTNRDLESAIRYGNKVASISATRRGTTSVSSHEVIF